MCYEGALQAITPIRAAAWIAVVVAGWSLNIRWGLETTVRAAAPPQFERHIVGAALLALLAAAILMFASPRRKSARTAAFLALLLGAGSHAIAWWIRALASEQGHPQLTEGSGWTWLFTGTALSAAAGGAALILLIARRQPTPPARQKRRRRAQG